MVGMFVREGDGIERPASRGNHIGVLSGFALVPKRSDQYGVGPVRNEPGFDRGLAAGEAGDGE
jgi:hypothetical protein